MAESARQDFAPAARGRDVFVSYAREDQERVRVLVTALESAGWSVFWDRQVPTGWTWRDYIGGALQGARCVVVVWSRASVASRFVAEEADSGLQRQALMPVLIDLVTPPFGFGSVHAADLSDWQGRPDHPGWSRFLDDMRARLAMPTDLPDPGRDTAPRAFDPAPYAEPAIGPATAPVDAAAEPRPAGEMGPSTEATSPDERRRWHRRPAARVAAASLAVATVLAVGWTLSRDRPGRVDASSAVPSTAGSSPDRRTGSDRDGDPALPMPVASAPGAVPSTTPASPGSAESTAAQPATTKPSNRPGPSASPAPAAAGALSPAPPRPSDARCSDLFQRQQLGESLGTADQQYYKSRCVGG